MKRFNFTSSLLILALSLNLTGQVSAASISGTVKFDGEPPKFKEIKMDADPICLTHHKEAVFPQTLVLGEGNTMGSVFVYVKKGLPSKQYPAPTQEVVVDQQGCMYTPHIIAAMVGQPVKILNPDGTLHNVHALSKVNQEFNMAMPKFKKDITKTFDKPEFMFALKCDVHPWMGAWMSVMPHPFFAVTAADGKFSIANLPAGTYEVEAWHEKLGTKTASVTVAEADAATADFAFSTPKKN